MDIGCSYHLYPDAEIRIYGIGTGEAVGIVPMLLLFGVYGMRSAGVPDMHLSCRDIYVV